MISALCLAFLAAAPSGTVTVPLAEALPLLTDKVEAPPLAGAVVAQQLTGEVTAEALHVTAKWTVTVLDGSRWTRLSLLKLSPGVMLDGVDGVPNLTLAVHHGELVALGQTPGTYALEARLTLRSPGAGSHAVRLERGADALEGLLRLESPAETVTLGSDREVASTQGSWTVQWRAQPRAKEVVQAARPPLEPLVKSAHAQLVTTVEGRARLVMTYALQVDRLQTLRLKAPEGWVSTRLSVNGAARVPPSGEELEVQVEPERSGGQDATVELTLERAFGVFHLSGRLALELPAVSWPTSVVAVSVHLPAVFDYRRLGGSLEPAAKLDWNAPTMPGSQLLYEQHLVATAGPTLELAYSVNLDNRYFKVARSGQRGSYPDPE